MTLPTNADIDAAIPATGPKPRSDLTNALLKNALAEISINRRDSISPKDYGGDPNGVLDSTAAVAAVINGMNAGGVAGRFDGGIWRVTSALPTITRPIVVGDGSGEIFVDYAPTGGAAIFDAKVAVGEVYTVTAVDLNIVFDAFGAFTSDSSVTRLTLSLAGAQVMPAVGAVGKLTGTNVLVPNDNATDQVGSHVAVLAVSGSFVYLPWAPVDTFSTGMQLVMLGTQPVSIEGLRFRGNYATVVSADAKYHFLRVQGAIFDRLARLRFRDGSETAIQRLGCFMGGTHAVRVARMRSALLSEATAIAGYGVVDVGCWQPEHTDLGGYLCRHLYTTTTIAPTGDRVAWGRTFRPLVVGGQAAGCSAACFDTHADAWEAEFRSCRAIGGYFGEDGSPLGFQIRGTRGRIDGCTGSDFMYGFQFAKTVAAEGHNHTLVGCRYFGTGVPLRIVHDAALTGANARQRVFIGDCHFETITANSATLDAADVELIGTLRITSRTSGNANHAMELDEASTIKSAGGELVYDCSGVTAGTGPRVLRTIGDGNSCPFPGLNVKVISGAISWQSVVHDNDNPAAAMGEMFITCDADKAPSAVSGGFSSFGTGSPANLILPAGALKLKGTVNGGRAGAPKTAAYTIGAFDHGRVIQVTATATIGVSAAAVLGPDFECQVQAFAAVTIDGPGVTNVAVAAGQSCRIRVTNGVVYAVNSSWTQIS